jgi:hypothetical protein
VKSFWRRDHVLYNYTLNKGGTITMMSYSRLILDMCDNIKIRRSLKLTEMYFVIFIWSIVHKYEKEEVLLILWRV